MALNKEWHLQYKMPKNATFEQKVLWHTEHNTFCTCHPGFPKKLLEEMRRRGMRP